MGSKPRSQNSPSTAPSSPAHLNASLLGNITYEPCPPRRVHAPQRGIAICSFPRALLNTIALIRTLRTLGTTLPIEVFHNDELFITRSDTQLRVVPTGLSPTAGWSCKVHAALHSSFPEVMVMDVDIAPLMDLAELFDSTEFTTTGTLFFYDSYVVSGFSSAKPAFLRNDLAAFDRRPYERWQVLTASGEPNPYPSEQLRADLAWTKNMTNRAETSVFLLDRCRQPRLCAILEAEGAWLEANSYGDKETFWMAAELAGTDYAFSPYGAGAWGWKMPALRALYAVFELGPFAPGDAWTCYAMFAHFDPRSGALAFLHGEKHNAWLASNRKYVTSPSRRRTPAVYSLVLADVPLDRRVCLVATPLPLPLSYKRKLKWRVSHYDEVRILAASEGLAFCGSPFIDGSPADRRYQLGVAHNASANSSEPLWSPLLNRPKELLQAGCDDRANNFSALKPGAVLKALHGAMREAQLQWLRETRAPGHHEAHAAHGRSSYRQHFGKPRRSQPGSGLSSSKRPAHSPGSSLAGRGSSPPPPSPAPHASPPSPAPPPSPAKLPAKAARDRAPAASPTPTPSAVAQSVQLAVLQPVAPQEAESVVSPIGLPFYLLRRLFRGIGRLLGIVPRSHAAVTVPQSR